MNPRRRTPLFPLCAALLAFATAAPLLHAEPLAELASFSAFKNLDLAKLNGGKVQMTRGPSMSFARGLAIESCFLIRKPLAKATDFHLRWNSARHPELRVWAHGTLPARPSPGDFKGLAGAPLNSSVKSFVAATEKLGGGSTALQLSTAEAKSFPGGSGLPTAATFWSGILAQRASAFAGGGLGKLPPYETTGETARPADEAARILKEVPKVRGQFSGLLSGTPFGGSGAAQSSYWQCFDVEGQAAVALGAQYSKSAGATWQGLDAQYYASGGFYVLLTLYQMWPVNVGGQEATLVWRGDLISAPQLGALRGMERMGSGSAMMRETQKAIDSFLKDADSK